MVEAPTILLHHDGELDDVRDLLRELRAHFDEFRGADPRRRDPTAWDLVIATPRRLLHRGATDMRHPGRVIVVLDGDSRTLRAHLRRMHVDLMVRRPVHPMTMRQLLLHALYRGPERRQRRRIALYMPIRVRGGLVPKAVTLADLSQRGCRLLCPRPYQRGRTLKLGLPAEVTGSRSLALRGQVIRSSKAPDRETGLFVVVVRFDEKLVRPGHETGQRLSAVLERYREGPPTLIQGPPASDTASRHASRPAPGPAAPPAARTTIEATPEPSPPPTPEAEPAPERRRNERLAFDRRVVALGEQATRVLIGRDISRSGMRVEQSPALGVGDRFKIALHAVARDEPLVVDAHVDRDDGEAGLVLRFDAMDETRVRELERIIEQLPLAEPVASDDGEGAEQAVVVSEIVEQKVG